MRAVLEKKTDIIREAEWDKKSVLKVQYWNNSIIHYSPQNCTGVCPYQLLPSHLTDVEVASDFGSAEPWPAMVRMGTGEICVTHLCERYLALPSHLAQGGLSHSI